jgi:hypothetical protein
MISLSRRDSAILRYLPSNVEPFNLFRYLDEQAYLFNERNRSKSTT